MPDHTLVRRIGRGSYGEVWLARSALGTWRAVKIVLRSTFDADRPYEREFAGIQRFEPISRSHESQLNILQVGRVEDGFYYVMELADDMGHGRDIDEGTYTPRDLRSEMHLHGRLPVANCLRLGLALTTALEHLHKHGLVHRDIKPSNIVFVNGIPKLADIGLVAQAEATMSFVGTEGFVPPEGPGTTQADIYSLGKVLYELSTGHDRHQFPELPTGLESLPDGDQLGELNEVLLKACQRNPAERYKTAAEMHADLALLDSGRSVVRLRGIERRLRFVQRASGVVTLVAVLAAGLYLWQTRQTRIVRGLVEEKTKLANTNERLAEENRKRIVRLGVANGVSLMDHGDPAGALLWFANALTEVTNTPEESIHRIRIQQALNQTPRLLHVLPPETAGGWSLSWSPDGKRIATTAFHGRTAVWDVETGIPLWKPITLPFDDQWRAQFMSDGRRFWVHGQDTVDPTGTQIYEVPKDILATIESDSGRVLFSVSDAGWEHLQISPKDQWFAIVDKDHIIHLHDATDGGELAQLRGHTNKVVLLEFNPAGDQLASTEADGTVRIWRLPSGELTTPPLHCEFEPRAVRFSPDGRILAVLAVAQPGSAAATNSAVEMWEVSSGKRVGPDLKIAGVKLGILAFLAPEGRRLFLSTDKDNGIFDTQTGERLLPPFAVSMPSINVYAFSRDGRRIALGGEKGFLGAWSLESGEPVIQTRLGGRDWADIDFNSDGSKILATRDDGTAMVLDNHLPQKAVVRRLSTSMGWPGYHLRQCLSAERRRLLLRRDGLFSVLDLDRLTDWQVPPPDIPYADSGWAAIDASGHQCAIHYRPKEPSGAHFMELWRENEKGWNRVRIQLPAAMNHVMRFSDDGSRVASEGEDKLVRFWNTRDGKLERSIEATGHGKVMLGGKHRFGFTGAYAGTIQDLVAGTSTPFTFPPERGGMHMSDLAVAPGGDRFAIESGGSSAARFTYTCIISTSTGLPLTPILEHGGPLHCAEFSPDGHRVLTTGLTPYVRVWNAETGEQSMQLDLGNQPLRKAQWSLDGRFIVARSDERTVRVWDSTTGEAVTPIIKHTGEVRYAILAQQNRLITLSQPDLISTWELKECELPSDVLADYAKFLSGRYLSVNGVLIEVKPNELAELGRSLRQRAPQLFE